MAIIKYVPKEVPIKDYRNDKGGYYVATCDFCSREFYPKKRAKYCSHNCLVLSYRQRVANGQVVKFRGSQKVSEDSQKKISIIKDTLVYKSNKSDMLQYLKDKFDITKVVSQSVFSEFLWKDGMDCVIKDNLLIKRINQIKYELYKV